MSLLTLRGALAPLMLLLSLLLLANVASSTAAATTTTTDHGGGGGGDFDAPLHAAALLGGWSAPPTEDSCGVYVYFDELTFTVLNFGDCSLEDGGTCSEGVPYRECNALYLGSWQLDEHIDGLLVVNYAYADKPQYYSHGSSGASTTLPDSVADGETSYFNVRLLDDGATLALEAKEWDFRSQLWRDDLAALPMQGAFAGRYDDFDNTVRESASLVYYGSAFVKYVGDASEDGFAEIGVAQFEERTTTTSSSSSSGDDWSYYVDTLNVLVASENSSASSVVSFDDKTDTYVVEGDEYTESLAAAELTEIEGTWTGYFANCINTFVVHGDQFADYQIGPECEGEHAGYWLGTWWYTDDGDDSDRADDGGDDDDVRALQMQFFFTLEESLVGVVAQREYVLNADEGTLHLYDPNNVESGFNVMLYRVDGAEQELLED